MNKYLQNISDSIQQNENLTPEQKDALLKLLKEVDKELEIVSFKLDRTEKVKRTTAILLEETIAELEEKRKSVEESNNALQKSLEELKAAQAQLIQSEKMASLGELTAGIAHEIQNPLNFVNNFSEINRELIEELISQQSILKSEEIKELLEDIAANEKKITHHGKRADSIVKGMLQHSRTSSGQKELTDINTLCDEYVRLAYHGLRAKEKSFNARFETSFDSGVEKIMVVPQDIGRVVLNLVNNAFHAVNEKEKRQKSGTGNEGAPFEPSVTVSTAKKGDKIQIRVTDNGNGIPASIKDKIFQPFFTTKPTGQGTGLGLSLSYDIIKAHGGDIEVGTKEGEGTEFTIIIPAN